MAQGLRIDILCCNYTNLAEREDFYEVPVEIEIKRFPCGGHIEVTDILRALRLGASGVMVCACEKGTCHNGKGNERAEKKVLSARNILQEIGMEPERITFYFVPRLDAESFVEDLKEFYKKLLELKIKERSR